MPAPGCVGQQLLAAARRCRRAGGRDSGCWAGRSRRRSARPRECRAGRGCRRGCARRRSRSAPGAARRDGRRASGLQLAIVGAEVVAPFADAMRLVDRDQRQRARGRPAGGSRRSSRARARRRAGRARRRGTAAIGRSRSLSAEVSEAARMPIASAARIWSCISAISGEMTSAVPVARQRRQLVAERLARAGRHHRQRVLARPSPGRRPAPARRGNASKPKRALEDVRRRDHCGDRLPRVEATRPLPRLPRHALGRLAVPQLGVEPAALEQLLVRAALGDPAVVEHDDLVGVDDGRQAVGDDDRGAAARRRASSVSWIACSVRLSSALVASSRIRIGGFLSRVRAIATRCFSPPDSLSPRSPTIDS